MVTRVETDPTFTPAIEETLFDASAYFYGLRNGFAVDPDGQRFLMVKPSSGPTADNAEAAAGRGHITVVQNWFEELQQRVPLP